MRHDGTSEQVTGARLAKMAAWLALSAAVLLVAAGPAGAHGGDTAKIHACVLAANGGVKIVGPHEACPTNSVPLDWSSTDTNTTYSAGAGLSLSSANVFSIGAVPWTALTDIPSGFADGIDDVGASIDMKSDDASAAPMDRQPTTAMGSCTGTTSRAFPATSPMATQTARWRSTS